MIATFFTKSNPIHYILAFLYLIFLFYIKGSHDFSALLSLPLLLISIFFVNFIISKNTLNKNNNFGIVAICFFIGLLIEDLQSHDLLFSNIFLLLALRRIYSIRTPLNINKKVFDAAFWILMGSIFYTPILLFFILLLITLLLYSHFNLNTILIIIFAIISGASFIYFLEIINSGCFSLYQFIKTSFFEITRNGIYLPSFNDNSFIDFKWSFKIVILLVFLAGFISLYIWNGLVKTNERRRSITLVLLTSVLSLIIVLNNLNSTAFIFLLLPVIVIFTSYLERSKSSIIKNLILSLSLILPYLSVLF
jgi:hypothetical protein